MRIKRHRSVLNTRWIRPRIPSRMACPRATKSRWRSCAKSKSGKWPDSPTQRSTPNSIRNRHSTTPLSQSNSGSVPGLSAGINRKSSLGYRRGVIYHNRTARKQEYWQVRVGHLARYRNLFEANDVCCLSRRKGFVDVVYRSSYVLGYDYYLSGWLYWPLRAWLWVKPRWVAVWYLNEVVAPIVQDERNLSKMEVFHVCVILIIVIYNIVN